MNKKIRFSLLTLLTMLCNMAFADAYTVDFNTAITVPSNNHSDPIFQVATGWTRIADRKAGDNYYGTAGYYMLYTYSSTQGVNESGALLANAQQAPQTSYDGTIETVHDYIVTPKVSGTVTLKVKAYSSTTHFINFYAVDDDATTIGDEITADFSSEINTSEFVTATLTLNEATRIAIRGQWVYMDDFTATSAEIPQVKALTVTSVMNTDGQSGYTGTNPIFEQQPDGKLLVKLKATIQNSGNVNLIANDTENYTLTLASATSEGGSKTYYEEVPISITNDLLIGESTTVDIIVAVNYTGSYASYRYWFVRENVSGTTSSNFRYATSVAYEPKLVFRKAESDATSSLSGTQAYGMITESTTKKFEIANTGTAPLTIKSITLPTGFTSANIPEITGEGLVIAKGASQALDITLPTTTFGNYSGNLVIVYLDATNTEKTYTLAFSGNVQPVGTWCADFNGEGTAIAYPAGSVAEGGINSDYTSNSGNYDSYLKGRTYTENNKFITPKLHATAGQQLTFDVKGYNGNGYYAKVYVSTDRKTWGDPIATYTYGETEGAVAIGSSDWTNKSITFDAEGDYYVAFALYGEFKIDNIIGLTKVDVAHDLYIKSVNWPDASIKSGASQQKPSLEVIPLTDETAENYTVKYVCGETVLATGTPVALTASANFSNTLSFSWTPVVESTTAYPGSKVVFEFTDGTKYESEGFDLTVTNEPIFHFVNSIPSSKWTEPSDHTTPVAFGKTNTADKKTFYVYNWGSAPLTVKSIVAPDGFTATPTEQFTVAAFNESNLGASAQAVEITFSATDAGNYSGNMVITYVDGTGADKTFTLALSGTKLDPTKWYADFNNQQWPAGSVYQSNVSISYINTGDYGLLSSSSTNNLFITPKLTATAGEVLQFDASTRNSYYDGTVKVYISTDRETWGDPVKEIALSKTENTSKATYDYTFENAGDYYVAFELNEARVDEIYGLTPAAVAHDWTIASSNVPTEAMQNIASTATVNILNLGLADEVADSYTVTAYVDGKVAGTSTGVAIPMNHKLSDAGTQLSVNFLYPKVGTFPVYVEVKAGDYSVATEPVDVTFAEEVANNSADMAGNGTSGDVPLNLNYKNSESVTLYNAETLAGIGLVNGSKISSITYKGYKTSDELTTSFQVYYKWTDDQTLTNPATSYPYAAADNGMTKLIDEDHTWNKVGSSTKLDDIIVLNFNEPLVYEAGKSLVIYMHSYVDSYKMTYFEKSNLSNDFCYSRKQDAATLTNNWSKTTPAAIHIALVAESATLSGTVKTSADAAIEGATVTLKADNGVEYTGTTNAEGVYSINVIQAGLDFTVTVEAENYEDQQFAYSLGGSSKTLDIKFYPELTLNNSEDEVNSYKGKADVTVARTLKAGWNAVVLPFALTADDITNAFGADAEVATYDGDEQNGDNVHINFAKATTVAAGVPFLLYLKTAPASAPVFTDKAVNFTVNNAEGNVFDFVGTFANTTAATGDYILSGGKFKNAAGGNAINAYRAYLKLKGAAASRVSLYIDGFLVENETTAITGAKMNGQQENVYSLSGQKMNNQLKKGIYIINGKKVVIK